MGRDKSSEVSSRGGGKLMRGGWVGRGTVLGSADVDSNRRDGWKVADKACGESKGKPTYLR